MIARAALNLKDTFALRFASIHSVLDSVEFLENSEVILAKFSSSFVYIATPGDPVYTLEKWENQ